MIELTVNPVIVTTVVGWFVLAVVVSVLIVFTTYIINNQCDRLYKVIKSKHTLDRYGLLFYNLYNRKGGKLTEEEIDKIATYIGLTNVTKEEND